MSTARNMVQSTLILSSENHFGEMVHSALERRKIKTSDEVKVYLRGLLTKYLDVKNLFESEVSEDGKRQPQTLAEMYLIASQSEKQEKIEILRKLGDRSLYMAGFFSDYFQRKVIDVDYYVNMGERAYETLSDSVKEESLVLVFKTFSKQFVDFVDVLTVISQQAFSNSDKDVLRLYDKYLKTGSELAKDRLLELGILNLQRTHLKSAKQD